MADASDPAGLRRPPTPRWVKVFGIIAVILVVLVILKLTGVAGKGHGPGRHGGAPRQSTGVGAGMRGQITIS